MLNDKEKTFYKTYYTGSLKITNAIQIHSNKFHLKLKESLLILEMKPQYTLDSLCKLPW